MALWGIFLRGVIILEREYKIKNLNIWRILLLVALFSIIGITKNFFFVITNIVLLIVSLYWLFSKNSTIVLKIISVLMVLYVVFAIMITPIIGNILVDKVEELKKSLGEYEFYN